MDVRTSAKYRSMAQLERSECVPTRFMSIPYFSGPSDLTWATMWERICFAVICSSLFVLGWANVLTDDFEVVSSYPSTRLIVVAQARTGQRVLPVTLCCVTVSIFSPFFCSTNVMETHSAAANVSNGRSCVSSVMVPVDVPVKNRTPSQVMMFVFLLPSSLLVLEYSQERMAKKRAPRRSEPCAEWRGEEWSS